MVYRAENYIHEMDRKAFAVLNTFPKFVKLCEAYSANIDEKAAKIDFLSSAIRLNENQMPEVYNLLPPICEKLGIEVPELYYLKSKEINAGTVGTSTPSIYVTSALVEKVPAELIAKDSDFGPDSYAQWFINEMNVKHGHYVYFADSAVIEANKLENALTESCLITYRK